MSPARRNIGFVWQEFNLVERLPVITNVLTARLAYNHPVASFFGYFNAEHRQIALESLGRVNRLHRATNRADKLSGGEKQRVSIARAISQQPKILLADETTFGDYSYTAGDNQIIYAEVGKFSNIASHVRINPGNHPMERVTLHHMTYRRKLYGFGDDDAEFLSGGGRTSASSDMIHG